MTNLEARTPPRTGNEFPADADLLAWWCAEKDTSALDALVRRHGGMVLGVCRRVLGNAPDAEDAFQATFLIFVQRAGARERPAQVAGWLPAVALRVARKARAARPRRHEREAALVDIPDPIPPESGADVSDLRRTLDEELDRLPEKYRLPIVLCELEGHTLDEAAQMLGWPKGTVAGRLSRGREQLRHRLSRRGVGLPLFLSGLLPIPESSAPPDPLVSATVATATGENIAAPPVVLARAVQLGAVRRRFGLFALLLLAGALLAALGWRAGHASARQSAPEGAAPALTAPGGCHAPTS
ncbi:sigma-70 family rna polymerase sigma factor : RNA polymerase sigma factor, sigma-70 family OS=Singulisphaera acidiphila (strain ATCC BAA-1392 / DSM 18658 / VKM B-2454 / MOB10) GN=Sinac_6419 PE=4 SV=1: Sigma70_r2: Sigma70_r4_2 [Gemmata massiliana]|uniref:ECF RNA polymerase sigma factor SigE n=1 Tax=Gemmata massiliana TaxID=1210884 RepID=A0A6P2D7R5_9BACT|nr:sigma-70 family RNA polymerase sigma factor [Gemmata massiliana]VTR95500.1 sigma-70 family rna polymerase sigma factor : RNA polymerase sigma factor, sigma-70 family OS=Singulisphaera acidiphila (strain ATCC BAA-1392 / DSM 18658 / VKM B-2454 / MOB10) GN=Sinac_6419 PE=4 SV=1: Sigma70_r2: Sigma70_r4_2 [Gemmata massiliana]